MQIYSNKHIFIIVLYWHLSGVKLHDKYPMAFIPIKTNSDKTQHALHAQFPEKMSVFTLNTFLLALHYI